MEIENINMKTKNNRKIKEPQKPNLIFLKDFEIINMIFILAIISILTTILIIIIK